MGLGRAQKLEWMLFRNFPRDEHGHIDWLLFEQGPPEFLVEFLARLEDRSSRTWQKLEKAQTELGMPSWKDVPTCPADPICEGRYVYDPQAWGRRDAGVDSKLRVQESSSRVDDSMGTSDTSSLAKKQGINDRGGRIKMPANKRPKHEAEIKWAGKKTVPRSPSDSLEQRGWKCPLLPQVYIGVALHNLRPAWFNDPACGAVVNGVQQGLSCGLFAVNHCLSRHSLPIFHKDEFIALASDGYYPSGEFDNSALQRNLESRGFFFRALFGQDYEEAVACDGEARLAVFAGNHALGCVVHTSNPQHWVAVVPPLQAPTDRCAALLCDSLYRHAFALSVNDMQDFFTNMALHHLRLGDAPINRLERELRAAAWSAYTVTR